MASAFSSVIKDLQPSDREFCHARRASTALRVTLKRHLSIGILEEVRFGSQTKRTGIRGQTDVDMLFVLDPRGVTRNGTLVSSARVLDRVSRAIARRYASSKIRRDGHAVAVHFSRSGVALDVVPAIPAGKRRSASIYLIPDGRGGWMRTAPKAELRRFRRMNRASQQKLSRTLQLLKFWKCCRVRRIPVRSYYLELLLTKSGLASGRKSYCSILASVFQLMASQRGLALRDPSRRVGGTPMATSRAAQERALREIRRARDHTRSAAALCRKGQDKAAASHLRRVFNGQFPFVAPETRRMRRP